MKLAGTVFPIPLSGNKNNTSPVTVNLGLVNGKPLILDEQTLAAHCLLVGPTGMGKSRTAGLMAHQLILQGEGVTEIDLDSQTTDDQMGHLTENRDRLSPLRQYEIYYYKPTEEQAMTIDPFYSTLTGKAYDFWLSIIVWEIARCIGMAQGVDDYRDQLRRSRVLCAVLYMVGVNDADGRHYGMSHLLDALDFGSKAWERMYIHVREFLPKYIAKDLWKIHTMSLSRRESLIESTMNIVVALFAGDSPLLRQTFNPNGQPIDFLQVVRRKAVFLASLDTMAEEQARVIVSIILHLTLLACWTLKVRRYLFLEEAEAILREDFNRFLNQARKRNCRGFFSVQSISGLKNRFADVREKALSQPGVIISFQQKNAPDEIVDVFATRMFDFTPNMKPSVIPLAPELRVIPEHSISRGKQRRWGSSASVSETDALGGNRQAGINAGNTETDGTAASLADGLASGTVRANMFSHEPGKSPRLASDTNSFNDQTSRVATQGTHHALALSSGLTFNEGANWVHSLARLFSQQMGGGTSEQASVAFRHMLFPRNEVLWLPNGLLIPPEITRAYFKWRLTQLDRQEVLIAIGNQPTMQCRIHDFPDPFDGRPHWGEYQTRKFIDECCRKPCFFVPEGSDKWVPAKKSPTA